MVEGLHPPLNNSGYGPGITIIVSKLCGKMGCAWQDICTSVDRYQDVKDRLLKVCGYTPKLAAEVFYGFRCEHSKGMTADQLYHRGVQLFRRMIAPHRVSEVAEFTILRGYMCTLDEILEHVGNSRAISKHDLAKGFYQIAVEPDSVAFITPFGKYAFQRMPFGLKNAPAIFQRCMEVVLGGCYTFAAPYIDDIIVFSENGVGHVHHLWSVFAALQQHGLTVKLDKCEFGRCTVVYLGHVIGNGVLAVPRHRATAMADFIQPRTKKQLRAFLGAASYYRRFVKGFSNFSSVLTPATSKAAPSVVGWSEAMLEAFRHLKVCLCDVCTITIPSQEDSFVLHTDAVLELPSMCSEMPAAFFSRQLQGAQHNYSVTELEGLAIFKAIHFFAHFLYGRRFVVVTDHKALVAFLKSRVLNKRLHGWVLQLLDFDFDFEIVYRPGKDHQDADALSRQAWDSCDGDPCRAVEGDCKVIPGRCGDSPHRDGKEKGRREKREEEEEPKTN